VLARALRDISNHPVYVSGFACSHLKKLRPLLLTGPRALVLFVFRTADGLIFSCDIGFGNGELAGAEIREADHRHIGSLKSS